MAKNDKVVASVLAFEKKLVPSDGYLYGTNWNKRNEQSALKLIEKSVRGTVSHRLKNTTDKDLLKLNMDIAHANPQTVDACALGEHQDTLKVGFTLKVLGGVEHPSACNNEIFLKSYNDVAKNYITTYGFSELAKRYALNLANARFLWRNRVGAEKVEVVVTVNDQAAVTFNALNYPLHNFDATDENIQNLAHQIASALKGEIPYLLIKVEAYALVGKGQEVYPSEELVLDKGKGEKSKILYHVNDVAAMHSQKLGNALRTIDTWYPEFDEKKTAIAIEPYGAVTNLGKAYRTPKDKKDFFTLFDKYALGESLENPEQEHYVMAVLVRGGVFGQSSKD
ncbi:type I-F CRISPR-associated protein Csy3 [Acinetobacter ursingii]|uniref:CRISPR type I-f/ypest-associated protein csy3 n=4 Tax=Acinetobacter TaxID=469 RepID=N9C1J2_9GAMM|nr:MULTISPECIES: type I-F CRISPR-associated protein Csy3 [Acinetobacter]ENV79712.1 CRISPR type I-f/ypest-associated protein csy3 [Acinetobacter ursingii ANC 3649]MDG9949175.1 type I-F CRISPR-associated protein Csy3 [Acinetobacter ursingii]MEC6126734.1 type I-F CRISPR-associated protein Csy3 [Acinetobacter ursingii]PZT87814.1 MAG: type I-F CRISPR-associated protein Csy3 [Acinetobacter sp.]QXZ23186.1 type I-F CRISPR-associated protein Csy3 [Acinetobacter septicus]